MRKDAHCEKSFYTAITMCRQKHTAKRHACFNLAFRTPFADCTPTHALAQFHSQRDPTRIGAAFAKNYADYVTDEGGKLCTHDATLAPSDDIPSAPSFHQECASCCPSDAGSDADLLPPNCKSAAAWAPESCKPSDSREAENSPSNGCTWLKSVCVPALCPCIKSDGLG
jgi:hypothetical protein